MGDLISREFLQTAIHNFFNGLNHTPTEEDIQRYIEVAPSVENKGEWIADVDKWGDVVTTVNGYVCSKCGVFNSDKDNFCPNCGADMRGKAE